MKAAKPTSASKPVKASTRRQSSAPAAADTAKAADPAETAKAPENQAQVVSRLNLEGLPKQSADAEEAVLQLVNIKYERLAQVFSHYCKASDCESVKAATRIKLGTRSRAKCASSLACSLR